MMVLGFTTSTDHSSIALSKNGKIIAETKWLRKQSEALTPKIKSIFNRKKISFKDIGLIAVDRGPGSFTGCRVAVNVAKTMAYTLGVEVFAPTSLDILAFGAAQKLFKTKGSFDLFTVFNAHRSLYYFAHYKIKSADFFSCITPPEAVSLEHISDLSSKLNSVVTIGNVPGLGKLVFPSARDLVLFASLRKEDQIPWAQVEPAYIRSPDAVTKLSKSP